MINLCPEELERLRDAAGPVPVAIFVRLLLAELVCQRKPEATA
jgi:hypothetical protein